MDTQSAIFLFLKENACSGYSLEAVFVKYIETRFQQFKVELQHNSNAVHLYLIGSHA